MVATSATPPQRNNESGMEITMLNCPVTRKDILKVVILLSVAGALNMFGTYRYNKGLEDMARYLASQQQQEKPSAHDSEWGMGSTK